MRGGGRRKGRRKRGSGRRRGRGRRDRGRRRGKGVRRGGQVGRRITAQLTLFFLFGH